jgi:uncharacterized membrane protein YsdA (DUF1294 family)
MAGQRDTTELPDFGDIPDPVAHPAAPASASPLRFGPDSAIRDKTRKQRLAALALSVGWLGAHLAVYGVRADLPTLPPLYVAVQVVLPLALALGSLVIAVRAGRLGLGVNIGLLTALALIGPISFWLVGVGAPLPRAPGSGSDSLLSAFVCLDITLAWAAVPILCAALSLRRAFPSASAWRSALIGSACGLFAGAVMNLHCTNVDRFHMLFGHGIPVLASVLAGAFLMQRLARI